MPIRHERVPSSGSGAIKGNYMSDAKRSILASIFLTAFVWPLLASADYIESVNGDLSGNFQNPTAIALVPNGSTTISGTIQGAGMGVSVDLDYFTVTVPVGQVLAAVNVLPGTVGGGAIGSFIGIYPGSTGVNPIGATSTDALGYYLYRAADIGTDILDDMGTFNFNGTNPSIGFIPPLPSANYTFWIQEGANGTFPYSFGLVLRSVPEPSTLLLLGLAGLAVGLLRHRREIDKVARSFGFAQRLA
jgi:hypothetical protein